MKAIKHGKKEFKLIETMFDMNDKRFHEFKKYFLQVIEKMDNTSFAVTLAKYKELYDKGLHSDAFIELYNFNKSIQLKEVDYDAYSFCYCLLCLEEGEDQEVINEEEQLKKLKFLRSTGLKRGDVEKTVLDFMKASPKTFGAYLQMLEILQAPIPDEYLKD